MVFGMFCLQVDKIIDQLQQFVQSFDLFGLKDYWIYLDKRLFSRLEDIYRTTVNKLRTSLYRYYVINTIQVTSIQEYMAWNTATLRHSYSISLFFQKGNLEKTQEFFQKQALELQAQAEWRDWFILPFIPTPEQNPAFAPYFSRQWADTFLVSLHNFLSILFQCMHILELRRQLWSNSFTVWQRAKLKLLIRCRNNRTSNPVWRYDPMMGSVRR